MIVSTIGAGLGGICGSLYVVISVVQRTAEKPERCGPPALGAVSAVVIDLCKEFYPDVVLG